ncbi:hypothetical protein PIB30_039146 [Stylosanthes scabra]|uniref:Uncharacterized protein n=1 Tax=Stylosanthes scabra TaxID=79078 RepID=A0ABU6UDY5_9FABA|nr:hypothetical protein [Stylosanthes scabra]
MSDPLLCLSSWESEVRLQRDGRKFGSPSCFPPGYDQRDSPSVSYRTRSGWPYNRPNELIGRRDRHASYCRFTFLEDKRSNEHNMVLDVLRCISLSHDYVYGDLGIFQTINDNVEGRNRGDREEVLTVEQAVKDKIDDEIATQDRLDADDLEALRKHRLQEMKKIAEKHSCWISLRHGEYAEIPSEKDFFSIVKASERVIYHFITL